MPRSKGGRRLRRKFDYGYVIVFSCFVLAFFYLGLGNITQNLYVVPVTGHYGFTRSEFSVVFSIISLIGILVNLTYDRVYRRFGIRLVIGTGTMLMAGGYFIYALADSLVLFYVGAMLFGMGMVYTSTLTFSVMVNQWFIHKRGLILGLIFAGSGLGGSVFSPLVASIITEQGFKRAYLMGAVILLILSVPLTLLIREPKEKGLQGTQASGKIIGVTRKAPGALMRQPRILSGLVCLFLLGFLIAPFLNITPSHMTDRNFDYLFASEVSGFVMLVLAFSKIFLGLINDRFGIRAAMTIGILSFIFSAVFLFLMTGETVAWLYAFTYGLSLATLSVLIPLFILAVSGNEDFDALVGIGVSLMSAGVAAGTPVLNLFYDLLGSYDTVLILFALLGAGTYVLTMVTLKMPEGTPALVRNQGIE